MADALDVLATYPITHLNGYLITWYTRQSPLPLFCNITPPPPNPNHIIAVHFIYTKHRQSMFCTLLVPRFYIIYYYVVVPSTKYSILFQVVNITQSQFPLVLFVLFYLYPFSLRYIHIMKIYKLNLFLLSLGFERGFVSGWIF